MAEGISGGAPGGMVRILYAWPTRTTVRLRERMDTEIGRLRTVAEAAGRMGLPRALDAAWGPRRLTVLLYHRIADPEDVAASGYDPAMASATPREFERQMDWTARQFQVVSIDDVRRLVEDGEPLPDRACLVTFDDGYLDNFTKALPVLRRRGLPAVLFLATGFVGSSRRPWWDEVARCMQQVGALAGADLPLIGRRRLETPEERASAHARLVRAMERIPSPEVGAALDRLREVLNVEPATEGPRQFVTWDEVRDMAAGGVAVEAHTRTHPILSMAPREMLDDEILGSANDIERETGRRPIAFAYPKGGTGDYCAASLAAITRAGIPLAFTTEVGPARPAEVRTRPLEIPRISVYRRDRGQVFCLKAMGVERAVRRPARMLRR